MVEMPGLVRNDIDASAGHREKSSSESACEKQSRSAVASSKLVMVLVAEPAGGSASPNARNHEFTRQCGRALPKDATG